MTKKIFLIFFLICLNFLVAVNHSIAYAEKSIYLRVINDTTPFYSDSNGENFMFYLPYTYYVKVLRTEGTFTHVECYGYGDTPALDGYVPSELLYNDNLEVELPFLNLSITTSTSAVLYSDMNLTNPIQYIFSNRTMHYYGIADFEKNIYFVEYNGRLGYISENDVYPFMVVNHPNELTFLPSDEEPEIPNENQSQVKGDFFSLKFIIIICLLFAGIIGMFIAFRPKNKNKTAISYYDENDYE